MKTTVELPDILYRQATAEAALRGRELNDRVEEGLRLVLAARPGTTGHPELAGMMKHALGVIASGDPDLGSNPEHLAGFALTARPVTQADLERIDAHRVGKAQAGLDDRLTAEKASNPQRWPYPSARAASLGCSG